MDLSKLKIEVYDFLALVLPGVVGILEIWATIRLWNAFMLGIATLSGTALTLLLLISFGAGHLIQEIGDKTTKFFRGKRFFLRSRDELWSTTEGTILRHAIERELGHPIASADAAFEYCLTRIEGSFAKRDLFLATSDLARGLVVLSFTASLPIIRIIRDANYNPAKQAVAAAGCIIGLMVVGALCWSRMVRFRGLSELPVFRAYLAQIAKAKMIPPLL